MLEVDLSLANLSLDLIGQATHLLEEAGDGDKLAFHRDVLDFRNCLLVEQPNGDFARTMARHLLFSTWQHMLFERLTQSSDRFLHEFASKAVKEVAYHRELSSEWTVRLGDGTEESARRMAEGLDWNWRFVPELFEVDETLQATHRPRHRTRPARIRGRVSHRDRGRSRRGEARRPSRPASDPWRAARSSQRASGTPARGDAIPAAHLSRRDLVMSAHFYPLKVAEIVPETAEANSIRFEIPSELRDTFAFKAGQHLTLKATIDGEEVRRNYSLCTAPDEQDWMVTVKRIAGGIFSNWVGDNLKSGDTIEVMPPHGSFTTEFEPTAKRHVVGIAGGSGITPVMSLLRTDAEGRTAEPVHSASTAIATAARSSSSTS